MPLANEKFSCQLLHSKYRLTNTCKLELNSDHLHKNKQQLRDLDSDYVILNPVINLGESN